MTAPVQNPPTATPNWYARQTSRWGRNRFLAAAAVVVLIVVAAISVAIGVSQGSSAPVTTPQDRVPTVAANLFETAVKGQCGYDGTQVQYLGHQVIGSTDEYRWYAENQYPVAVDVPAGSNWAQAQTYLQGHGDSVHCGN